MRKTRRRYIAFGALMALAVVCAVYGVSAAMALIASGALVFGMILDERTEFGDALALNTGAAGTYLIGDVIDLGVGRNLGMTELWLVITVDTTVTSGGAGTAQFTLASDAQAAIATDGSATVHFETKAFALAELVAGRVLAVVKLPAEGAVYERFLGILQTTGTAALTAGKINAFLTPDAKQWKALADGNDGI